MTLVWNGTSQPTTNETKKIKLLQAMTKSRPTQPCMWCKYLQ